MACAASAEGMGCACFGMAGDLDVVALLGLCLGKREVTLNVSPGWIRGPCIRAMDCGSRPAMTALLEAKGLGCHPGLDSGTMPSGLRFRSRELLGWER